tara:strand:+ start:1502 stop:1606 length:105 start_codon:yes stop_codon:yes gene_type:complete
MAEVETIENVWDFSIEAGSLQDRQNDQSPEADDP